jgi:hypothetical protein
MENKIPVLSTGGGTIASKGFDLQKRISDVFKGTIDPLFVTLIPTSNSLQLQHLYRDGNSVRKTVEYRIANGNWKLPEGKNLKQFQTLIAEKSKENLRFASVIVQNSARVLNFNPITSDSYGKVFAIPEETRKELLDLSQNIPPELRGNFQQIRVLVKIEFSGGESLMKHITYAFDEKRKHSFTLNELRSLVTCGTTHKGRVYNLICHDNKKKKVSLAIPDTMIHQDGSSHITICSGDHQPKLMSNVATAIKDNVPSIKIDSLNYHVESIEDVTLQYLTIFGI